jgi:hypothetical protein
LPKTVAYIIKLLEMLELGSVERDPCVVTRSIRERPRKVVVNTEDLYLLEKRAM